MDILEMELWKEFEKQQDIIDNSTQKRQKMLLQNNEVFKKMSKNKEKLIKIEAKFEKLFKGKNSNWNRYLKKSNLGTDLQDIMEINQQRDRMKKIIKDLQNLDRYFGRKRKKNSEEIKYLEEEIELLDAKLELVRNALRNYYLEILARGEKVKKNGIVWIVHKLWKIKVIVYASMLPQFLDRESAKYVFKYANYDFKQQQLGSRIAHFKEVIKKEIVMNNKGKIDQLMKTTNTTLKRPMTQSQQPTITNYKMTLAPPEEKTAIPKKLTSSSQKLDTSEIDFFKTMIKRSFVKKITSIKTMRRNSLFFGKRLTFGLTPNNFYDSTKSIKSIDHSTDFHNLVSKQRKSVSSYDLRKSKPTSQAGVIYQAILENKNRELKNLKNG
jgi:hypothetical protein